MTVSITENAKKMAAVPDGHPLTCPFPDNVILEVTNLCNLKCTFCYNPQMKRQRGFMEFSLFQKIVDEMVALNVQNLGLYTTGEAFLHPEIIKFIKYAKDKGIGYVYVTTNGQAIRTDQIREIIDSGLDSIKFSIDSGSKAYYEKLKINGSWEKLVETIVKFRELRDKSGSKMRIFGSYVIADQGKDNLDDYHKLFDQYIDETRFTPLHNQGSLSNFKHQGEVKKPCPHLWNRIFVTYDGRLTNCSFDFECRMTYGDLSKNTMFECWNNSKIQQYRTAHKTQKLNKMPMCQTCSIIKDEAWG